MAKAEKKKTREELLAELELFTVLHRGTMEQIQQQINDQLLEGNRPQFIFNPGGHVAIIFYQRPEQR